MKRVIFDIVKCLAVWLGAMAILVGLLTLTACIPNDAINENLINSGLELLKSEPHPPLTENAYHSIQDNYADAILLGVIANVSAEEPFTSAINTMYNDGGDKGEGYGLIASAAGVKPNTDYTRYWHGSMLVLRPMLTFADINGIKAISAVVMLALLSVSCFMLVKRRNTGGAVVFVLSLLAVQAFYVPFSLEFIIAFTVMLILCPFYIHFSGNNNILLLLSVLGGTLIAFTDFLTTETITLLVPLLLVFFIRINENGAGSFKENITLVMKCGGGWLSAYALTFVSKWALASVVTGENKFTAAIASLTERTSGNVTDFDNPAEQIFSAVGANLSMLFPSPDRISPVVILISILLYIAAPFAVFLKYRKNIPQGIAPLFAVIAIIPVVRFMTLSNHSYLHCFFTYRALSVTVMAMLGLAWYSFKIKPVKKKK